MGVPEMSSPPKNDVRTALSDVLAGDHSDEDVLSPIRVLAFWAAIALPFLYVPLLVTGLDNAATFAAFVALIACNAVALLVGHSHGSG